MALFHDATLTPTKAELLIDWVPTQPWGPPANAAIELVGAFRFNDPEGKVGIETHLVAAGDDLFQVPVTYRDEPLDGQDDALITEMHHSALGTRWVYDGLRDHRYVMMLAACAMTGQGEALGMLTYDGIWHIAPANVRIEGGGWTGERVSVDNLEAVSTNNADASATHVFENERFTLTAYRRPKPASRPPLGLTATWADLAAPVLLAQVEDGAA